MLITSLLSGNPKPKEDPNASPRPDYAPSYGYRTQSGERVTVEKAQSVATAYRAKNIISDDVAKMPWQVFQRLGKNTAQVPPDPVTRNLAYLLQVSPNIWGWTPFQFKKSIIEWQLFYGNCYIWSPIVGPRQLLILPANRTTPVFDLDGNVWYRHTFSNNQTSYIPAVEIVQALINPDETGFMGRGVITYARETFGRRLAANKTQSRLYSQGFMPAAYVKMAGDLNADARNKVRLSYEEQMGGGSENAYRLAVFDDKITEFQPIDIQLKDAQFLESIDATDRDLCNFFGLSEHMLNRGKEAYNSNEQKYIEYLQGTLDSYLVPLEETSRIRWLSNAEQPYTFTKFIRESLLRMDAKARAEVHESHIRSGMETPNEALEKEDMNGYPEGNKHYITANVIPIEQAGQVNPAPGQGG
jgi:HK97 family phage portal protein